MREIILIKLGEIVLKGLNRNSFEAVLKKNVKSALKSLGGCDAKVMQSAMYVTIPEGGDADQYAEAISKVFGIVAYTRACECEKNIEEMQKAAVSYLADQLEDASTFKVETKRSDKKFPMTSPEISAQVGGYILEKFPHLKVDVHKPEMTVRVEVRENSAYVHGNQLHGAGGLPVGTGGRAGIMISGGIDSPVAAWMMAKRGVELTAVHFASPPYTSERAEQKVIDLLGAVSDWAGVIKLHIVPFTELQEAIRDNSPEDMFTITMRRLMIKITERIAAKDGCLAMISGESLGQVASQTLPALFCTDDAANMPILRPLIGMDKDEIIRISRKIGTFDISVQPFEDCCTVFTPRHPRTRPTIDMARDAEAMIPNEEELIEKAIADVRKVWISPNR
ncbi:MAG: tRNA 4-thiouridine(8) synthase ThiI [Clostridia bacterium]|nr:tRNA 4-thiouridine(8) synthase ThiI [Oscillospiraceae bacterium]MBQ6797027.1 tRNA 4-thiouridine(8) synthase ThiI [Clostridia bacterium]